MKKYLYIGATKERCRQFILNNQNSEYLIQAFTLPEFVHKTFSQVEENIALRNATSLEYKMLMEDAVSSTDLSFFSYLQNKDKQFSDTLELLINFNHMVSANKVNLTSLNYHHDKQQDIEAILNNYRKLLSDKRVVSYCDMLLYLKKYITESELYEYDKITVDQYSFDDIVLAGSILEIEILQGILSLSHSEILSLAHKEASANVYLNRVYSRYDELVQTAKTILTILKKGDSPNDIIVSSSSFSEYMPFIFDVFNSYGIPVHISNGVPLKHTAMYAKIVSKLKICNTADSVLEFLNKQLQLKPDSRYIYHYQINRSVVFKVFEVLKEGLDSGITFEEIKDYLISDMKNETVNTPCNGIQFQELNQLVGVQRKHVIIIGSDSKNMPIKQSDNILYESKHLEEIFNQNNSYKLTSFHIDQVLQNNDNVYFITPTADGKHNLELSQIITDKFQSMPKEYNIDADSSSKNDLLDMGMRAELDNNSEQFITSIKSETYTSFDGALDEYDHKINYISISQLDRYAGCPLNYFFKYGLGLNPLKDTDIGFDVMEKGTLMHAFMEKLGLLIIKGELKPPASLNADFIKEALKILDEAYKETIAESKNDENIHHKIQYLSMIKGFNEELQSPGVIANFFEYFFDKNSNHYMFQDIYDVEHKIDYKTFSIAGVPIGGAIDRIDKKDDFVRVIDYKSSGKKDDDLFEKLKNFRSFQLPVYIMYCIEQIASNIDTEIHAMLFAPAQKTEFSKIKQSGNTTVFITEKNRNLIEEAHEGYLDKVKMKLKEIWDAINTGKFEFRGDEDTCKYCDYSSMCHKAVLRKEVSDEQI